MSPLQIVTATGLAAIVEWVEAFTIVLAVALTIGWPRALMASLAAILTLIVMTVAGGALLLSGIDIVWLQAVVGVFLLFFGSRWLAKAIARAAGRIPL
ncbi:MAG: COG4280 domain-containing protein, partial [Acidithiobacillus sp.]